MNEIKYETRIVETTHLRTGWAPISIFYFEQPPQWVRDAISAGAPIVGKYFDDGSGREWRRAPVPTHKYESRKVDGALPWQPWNGGAPEMKAFLNTPGYERCVVQFDHGIEYRKTPGT